MEDSEFYGTDGGDSWISASVGFKPGAIAISEVCNTSDSQQMGRSGETGIRSCDRAR